ncbi:hypothetical protein GOODEAATRI_005475 [Goodea atripinnis]|uniref:Fibronectin type-III domain-containing protein n=1 Tax=Goodea atripinnis TaxID=208336 RepID=A0ABV0NT69_9TELE
MAELDCNTNVMNVNWTQTTGLDQYTAWAISTDGHRASCNTTSNHCSIRDLRCGRIYEVAVTSSSINCDIIAGSDYKVQSAPCPPTSVSADLNCTTHNALISWTNAAATVATAYSVLAVSSAGHNTSCSDIGTSCDLDQLVCGQQYSVTVEAIHAGCPGPASGPVIFATAPCPPTNIQTSISCDQLTATVSWQQSNLAVGYIGYFDNQSGHYTSCVGTGTDTSCVVSGLRCGSVYRVWVKALGEQYNSTDSSVVSLTSAPCQPRSIEAFIDCQAHSATISWQPSVGAVSYAAVLTSSSGQTTSCFTNATSCHPSSLLCGEEYNVTIKALGEACNSTAHMAGHLITEPCAPVNLSVHYNGSAAWVMWSATTGTSSYSVLAATEQGLIVTCNSTTAQCYLTGLQCSQTYNITVKTRNSACNNTVTSVPYRLITGVSLVYLYLTTTTCTFLSEFLFLVYKCVCLLITQHPAHPQTFRLICHANSLVQLCPGSRVTSLWVTSPPWMNKMATPPPA